MLVASFTIGGTSSAVKAAITPSSARYTSAIAKPRFMWRWRSSPVADSATAMNIAMKSHVIGRRSR